MAGATAVKALPPTPQLAPGRVGRRTEGWRALLSPLCTGRVAWRALEQDVPSRWVALDGNLHAAGEAVHVLDLATGRILGSSPALERQVTGVAALPGGTTVVKCFTYDRNASEIRGFVLDAAAADAFAAGTPE